MRRITLSVIVSTAAVVLTALSASSAMAGAPLIGTTGSSTVNSSTLQASGWVYPSGWPTLFWVIAYPSSDSGCPAPTAEQLADSVNSPNMQTVGSSVFNFSTEIVGLQPNTFYCLRIHAENPDGSDSLTGGYRATLGVAPELSDLQLDPVVTRAGFSVQIAANDLAASPAEVKFERFAKGSNPTCEDGVGEAVTVSTGVTSVAGAPANNVSGNLPDLDPGTRYCARAYADAGATAEPSAPTAWQEFTTGEKRVAEVTDISFGLPDNPELGEDGTVTAHFDEFGAAVDTLGSSLGFLTVSKLPSSSCDSAGFGSAVPLVDESFDVSGATEPELALSGVSLGDQLCVHTQLSSAWGVAYGVDDYTPMTFGNAPNIELVDIVAGPDGIETPGAYLHPNLGETTYKLEYFVKQSGIACDLDVIKMSHGFGAEQTINEDLDQAHTVDMALTALPPLTTYCLRGVAENAVGETTTWWSSTRTRKDPVEPTLGGFTFYPSVDEDHTVRLVQGINDNGAADDVGVASTWTMSVYSVSGSCSESSVDAGTLLTSDSGVFSGSEDITYRPVGLTLGTSYCVKVRADSAWDGHHSVSYVGLSIPDAPTILDAGYEQTGSTLTVTGKLPANWSDTNYRLEWFFGGTDCSSPISTNTAGSATKSSGDNSVTDLSVSLHDLSVGALVCARFAAENDWGATDEPYTAVRIVDQSTPDTPITPDPPVDPVKTCFVAYKKTIRGRIGSRKFQIKVTATPSGDGQSARISLKLSRGAVATIVAGKRARGKKVVVTTTSGISVRYKQGRKKKQKTVRLKLIRKSC